MAQVVLTLKIMPNSPSSDLAKIEDSARKEIEHFAGKTEMRSTIEPIAFGLKAIKIIFVMNESKGSTESLENKISSVKDVSSVEVVDVRRAIG